MVGIGGLRCQVLSSPGLGLGDTPDKEILRKALLTDRDDSRRPYVDYVQTISTHPRYARAGPGKSTCGLFEDRMRELHFSEAEKANHRQVPGRSTRPSSNTDAALRELLRGAGEAPRLPQHDLHYHRGSPAGGDSTVHPDRPLPCAAHHLLAAPSAAPARIQSISSHLDYRADAAGVPAASLRDQRAGSGGPGSAQGSTWSPRCAMCTATPSRRADHEPRPIRFRDVLSRWGFALRHREGHEPRAGPGTMCPSRGCVPNSRTT